MIPQKRNIILLFKILDYLFQIGPLGNNFLKLLDTFPVTPYLSSRLSFMKWVHFINNKLSASM